METEIFLNEKIKMLTNQFFERLAIKKIDLNDKNQLKNELNIMLIQSMELAYNQGKKDEREFNKKEKGEYIKTASNIPDSMSYTGRYNFVNQI